MNDFTISGSVRVAVDDVDIEQALSAVPLLKDIASELQVTAAAVRKPKFILLKSRLNSLGYDLTYSSTSNPAEIDRFAEFVIVRKAANENN